MMSSDFIGLWLFEFSYGHREVVAPTESDASHGVLHGHTASVALSVQPISDAAKKLSTPDEFKAIKAHVETWIKTNWHMRFLIWEKDPMLKRLDAVPGILPVQFNPSWKEMAGALHAHLAAVLHEDGFGAPELRLTHGGEGGAISRLSIPKESL